MYGVEPIGISDRALNCVTCGGRAFRLELSVLWLGQLAGSAGVESFFFKRWRGSNNSIGSPTLARQLPHFTHPPRSSPAKQLIR